VGGGSLIKFAHAQNSGSHMENVDPPQTRRATSAAAERIPDLGALICYLRGAING